MPEERTWIFERHGRSYPISYWDREVGSETLLYLHGLGSAKDDFLGGWTEPAWESYRLVAVDVPGCGGSATYFNEIPMALDDVVVMVERLVDHLRLAPLTLIGHSMGGLAGLLFAMRNPFSLRRFINVEGNLGPEDCSVFSRSVFTARFLGREAAFMDDLQENLRDREGAGYRKFAAEFRLHVMPRAFFDYCRSIVDYSDTYPLIAEFAALDCPKLYVFGAENAWLPHIPRLRRASVEVCSIPNSNHFPMLTNPKAYYETLVRFMESTCR